MGGSTTYTSILNKAGHKLFGSKFAGAFPADRIPALKGGVKYAILNLDKHDEPGSHWIALAKERSGRDASHYIWVYDSYGRPTQAILPDIGQKFKFLDVDYDAEQSALETNCGARSLAWLWVFDKHGAGVAKLV